MAYIIDGHNLIPKVRGMSLSAMDDEQQLIGKLQEYCRVNRKSVEVFFDRAAIGNKGKRKYGRVTAHFVRQGYTADQAIIGFVKKLKGNAKNWTVVSSDHEVQNGARALGARVISSEEFAGQLLNSVFDDNSSKTIHDKKLDEQEVQDWLRVFGLEDDLDDED